MAPIVPDFVQMAVVQHGVETSSATLQLPNGPSTLSFSKDDFARADFKVDEFIAKHRRSGIPLETLKVDLGLYLEVLEVAMYDLINRDYQDFVSLSSNLVGLDAAIEDLANPLDTLRQDVAEIQGKMRETLQMMNEVVTERNTLREKRVLMERFLAIDDSIHRLQSLLGPTGQQNSDDVLEEAAHKWVFLQTLLRNDAMEMSSLPFVRERRASVDLIGASLIKKTAALFGGGLDRDDIPAMRQAMRIYLILDKTSLAEELFREKKVRSQLALIVDGCTKGKTAPTSEILTALYAQILEFVPSCLASVKEVITSTDSRAGNDNLLRGYDFMCGSIWPEIAHQLMSKVNNLFSPGNPDAFHANFTVTLSFLSRLEGLCTSQASVERLRNHKSHVNFLSKWNLTVYFQIRFQEIAGTFETSLLEGWKYSDDKDAQGKLKGTSVMLACLNVCWVHSVYLDPLLPKFWKMTLQLLSRYSQWMEELRSALELDGSISSKETTPISDEKSSSTVGISGDVPAGLSSAQTILSSSSSSPSTLTPEVKLGLIVDLMSDVDSICASLPLLFDSWIWPRARLAGGDAAEDALRDCLDAACQKIRAKLEPFVEFIIGVLIQQSSSLVKQVNDIPRKYRKTNREVPSKASPYVAAMLDPLKNFVAKDIKEETVEREIVGRVLAQISQVYLRHTSDVLTSVQKMEESLKRLKKARGGAAAAAASSELAVSDDDKIRLQIALDVKSFQSLLETCFRFDAEELQHFVELRALVVEATAGLTELVAVRV